MTSCLVALVASQHKNVNAYRVHSQQFAQLIKDIDVLLPRKKVFCFELGRNPREKQQVSLNDSFFGLSFWHAAVWLELAILICHFTSTISVYELCKG